MHVLLVAYDFPPTPSPQSLRWAYLVRELARAGHRVQVIAPDVPGYGRGGLPALPPEVRIHRVEPGKLTRLLLGRKARQTAQPAQAATATGGAPSAAVAAQDMQATPLNWKGRLQKRIERGLGIRDGLNWKGQLAEWIKAWASARVFPDYRVEWVPHAVAKLDELVALERPDIVLVSHEPACTLPVGLAAAERGLPLAVDMGDPVLAPYTPARWREKAFELEREVCKAACLVSVTTEGAATLLCERHGLSQDRLLVLRQGYDPGFVPEEHERWLDFDPQRLELLYTGSFYSFRRAEKLLGAILSHPEIRLTVATISAPEYLHAAAARDPEQIRIVGFLPHRVALVAQRSSDVLINIANSDPVQIPGKIFEYFGAGRPIIHIRTSEQDATSDLLAAASGGWSCEADEILLENLFDELLQLKKNGELSSRSAPSSKVFHYSWPELAFSWSDRVSALINAR